MATLILTAVGTAIGGPIGGALGAIAGRAIDGAVLRPPARQGPRLNELRVQTSSYGSEIPLLFGTIRVAGTVIWSTDLIETRSTDGGGKGTPDTVRYSYSASFAVLLSARPIRGVRRIWADGKLLRGAAGDFKSVTGFRLYHGDERQLSDPLIASAVGGARATAMRGQAYAVFEGMALADYGNRIPSLTFEVEADDDPVDVGAIATVVSGEAVTAPAALAPPFGGFSAYGDSRRAVLDALAAATGAWFAPVDGRLSMRAGGGAAAAIDDAGVAASGRGRRGVRTIAAADRAPRAVTIGHYDPARDYQAGVQRAVRPGPGLRERHEELAAVLPAGTAKQVAMAILARADADRWRRRVSAGWEALSIAPGDRVMIAGEATLWRVTGWRLEAMAVELALAPIALATASGAASSGAVVGAPDRAHGRTVLVAAELPPLDDTLPMRPQLTVVAGGSEPGWRGATLLLSEDGGDSWRTAASLHAPGIVGAIVVPPGPAGAAIVDHANIIVVDVAHAEMNLVSASDAALDRGANLALVGGELIQFGVAAQIGPRRWRLSRLWRGRRGTERAIGTHRVDEAFALLDADAATLVPLRSAIGATVSIAASSVGDGDALAPLDIDLDGRSVLPPSPVHAQATQMPDGTLLLAWVRRSRLGWRWEDGTDVPVAEENERYRVRVMRTGGDVEQHESGASSLTVRDAASIVRIEVAQLGTNGASAPADIVQWRP